MTLNDIHDIELKFSLCSHKVVVEGNLPQISDLDPSFYFM